MATWPTLSRQPVYPIEEKTTDNLIKTESEAGYQQTRPRHTRVIRTFKLSYKALTDADKVLLDTFFYTSTNHGSTIFAWTHPITAASHNVRIKPITWQGVRYNQWGTEIELDEA
jgi:hypothetical protein